MAPIKYVQNVFYKKLKYKIAYVELKPLKNKILCLWVCNEVIRFTTKIVGILLKFFIFKPFLF